MVLRVFTALFTIVDMGQIRLAKFSDELRLNRLLRQCTVLIGVSHGEYKVQMICQIRPIAHELVCSTSKLSERLKWSEKACKILLGEE